MKANFRKLFLIIFLKISLVLLNTITLGIPKLIKKIKDKLQALTTEETEIPKETEITNDIDEIDDEINRDKN